MSDWDIAKENAAIAREQRERAEKAEARVRELALAPLTVDGVAYCAGDVRLLLERAAKLLVCLEQAEAAHSDAHRRVAELETAIEFHAREDCGCSTPFGCVEVLAMVARQSATASVSEGKSTEGIAVLAGERASEPAHSLADRGSAESAPLGERTTENDPMWHPRQTPSPMVATTPRPSEAKHRFRGIFTCEFCGEAKSHLSHEREVIEPCPNDATTFGGSGARGEAIELSKRIFRLGFGEAAVDLVEASVAPRLDNPLHHEVCDACKGKSGAVAGNGQILVLCDHCHVKVSYPEKRADYAMAIKVCERVAKMFEAEGDVGRAGGAHRCANELLGQRSDSPSHKTPGKDT